MTKGKIKDSKKYNARVVIDTKFEKWGEVLDNIDGEIQQLHNERNTYVALNNFINQHPEKFSHTFFRHWLIWNYFTSASLIIRRLVDRNRRNYSLVLLLEDIRQYPDVITMRRFAKMQTQGQRHLGPRIIADIERRACNEFKKWVKGEILSQLDIQLDLDAIVNVSKPIVRAVNEYLAHNSKTKRKNLPGFLKHRECLITFIKIYKKYNLLIRSSGRFWGFPLKRITNEVEKIFAY